jgi:hypothetical protein
MKYKPEEKSYTKKRIKKIGKEIYEKYETRFEEQLKEIIAFEILKLEDPNLNKCNINLIYYEIIGIYYKEQLKK